MRGRGAAVAVALLGVVASAALVAAPASAQAPLDSPGKTDRIELVQTKVTPDSWTWQLFRNLSYPCSVSGYQTFAIGTPPATSPNEARPMWVRLRGGGVGYFNAAGQPRPSTANKTEEDLDSLIDVATLNSLNQRVNALPDGFRDLAVSMCDHDIFNGGDQPDPNNPNLTPDGALRTSNGLFATTAAIEFTQARYATTKTFLHGTSAGSFGGYGVAWSLQQQDRPISGFVADSGVTNEQYEEDLDAQGSSCARGPEALAAIPLRLHPELADPANQADLLIARGDLTVPVFNIWNRDDGLSCGTDQINCTMPDGSVVVLGSMVCKMDRISKAIAALPASAGSRTLRVCVRAPGDPIGTCARHVVTQPADYANTDPAGPVDYNGAIVDWVSERLADEPPALKVSLGKAKTLTVKGNRAMVTCIAGGYEVRTCKAQLAARSDGRLQTIARKSREVHYGADRAKLRLKLNPEGVELLRDAPRKGLRVKATVKVRERYTGRAGKSKRNLRLR